MIEYYSGGHLRWSFGFDNPNKAAVVFACLAPLWWALWAGAWRSRSTSTRVAAVTVAALGGIATWICLIGTGSRGGIAAALVALGYGFWQLRGSRGPAPLLRKALPLAALVLLLWMSVHQGLLRRTTTALAGQDRSTSNRLVLWGSALKMAREHPTGFGRGQSGAAYMEWYQPLNQTAKYRTLVNSPLTWLVERGWGSFVACSLVALTAWMWTRRPSLASPERAREIWRAALRGSLVAFAVAATFSTTAEEWRTWLIAAPCGLLLVGGRAGGLWAGAGIWNSVRGATLLVVSGCALLLAAGSLALRADPVRRVFRGNETTIVPREARTQREYRLVPDPDVLGPSPGRQARKLAMATASAVLLAPTPLATPPANTPAPQPIWILAGERAWDVAEPPPLSAPLHLLAPSLQPDPPAWLATRTATVHVWLPEIDEDGRTRRWKQWTRSYPHLELHPLPGVGTRMDSVWNDWLVLLHEISAPDDRSTTAP